MRGQGALALEDGFEINRTGEEQSGNVQENDGPGTVGCVLLERFERNHIQQ